MAKKLTAEDKKLLLELAREAVITTITGAKVQQREVRSGILTEKRGCFVCVKKSSMLRGCIGNFTSDKPLYQLVQEMAVSAATRDPRFYPMKEGDLEDFDLEISVLSPLQKVTSAEEIEVGVHGIYLEKNFFRGVLLPQVAVEYGWDRDTFLSQTCIKAGLKKDDWKDGADIYIFSADVFS